MGRQDARVQLTGRLVAHNRTVQVGSGEDKQTTDAVLCSLTRVTIVRDVIQCGAKLKEGSCEQMACMHRGVNQG